MNKKRILSNIVIILLTAALLASVGFNVYYTFRGYESYLQDTDEIYIMESGILSNNLEFVQGENLKFEYDFENGEYPTLIEKYKINETAGNGSEFERAMNLMNEYAPRLQHLSNYDNHIEMSAISLLDYSLDNYNHGINCRSKAQILNEMCLALGIYSRKVWIMPYSEYDSDCHVVNEVWDNNLNKWVMLDITNNQYWIDENGTPLSILEIREKGAMQKFCTPVCPCDDTSNPEALKEKYIGEFLYIMKNMVYTVYIDKYSVGEGEILYYLIPVNFNTEKEYMVSKQACESSPF